MDAHDSDFDEEKARIRTQFEREGWRIVSWGADAYDVTDFTIWQKRGAGDVFVTLFLNDMGSEVQYAVEAVLETDSDKIRIAVAAGHARIFNASDVYALLRQGIATARATFPLRLNSYFDDDQVSGEYYEISREKIGDFARAIKNDSMEHFEDKSALTAGYPSVVAPITFLTLIGRTEMINALRHEFGTDQELPPTVMVNTHITLNRPILAGDVLATTAYVKSNRALDKVNLIVIRQEYRDVEGHGVATTDTTVAAIAA